MGKNGTGVYWNQIMVDKTFDNLLVNFVCDCGNYWACMTFINSREVILSNVRTDSKNACMHLSYL